jgi:UDP-glucose 4-epimerase
MKTIFVVGGAGYIGSICVEQLLNEGYDVAVFDNLTEGIGRLSIPRRNSFKVIWLTGP